ncbi:MAG TPA: hypothetical protein VI653_13125 [Steroidobacteraceae bacterium]
MAAETEIIEFPFTQGQNEGQAIQMLPVGTFSRMQNARFRKQNRIGKRNGYTSKSSLDASGAALGNGSGRLACLGPNFCVVDDRFYQRDTVSDAWATPPILFSNGPATGNRLPNRFPQFMPAPAIEAATQLSDTVLAGPGTGTTQPSMGGMTYGLGRIWTASTFYRQGAGTGWQVIINAIDPTTSKVTFQQEYGLTSCARTDRPGLQLLTTGNGNTIVMITDRFTAGVKTSVAVAVCTSVTAGFGAEITFTCIQSAANYDPTVANGILFAYTLTGTPTDLHVTRMNPATMVSTASVISPTAGALTALSCFCNSTGLIWAGYLQAGVLTSVAIDAAMAVQATNATWAAQCGADITAPIMFAARSATSVVGVAPTDGATRQAILCADVSSGGGVSNPMGQLDCWPLSQPFSIGSQVFIWARETAGSQLGVASLLRVPVVTEYLTTAFVNQVFPIQATVDNYDVDEPLPVGTAGPVFPTPLSTSLGYVALINYTRKSYVATGAATLLRGFVVIPVRHRSEGLRYAPSCVVPCAGKQFVAAAQPMWVDRLGAVEAGFIQAPVSLAAPVAAAGGALTVSSVYSWTAIFTSVDANGNVSRSGPAVPVTITLGALETKATVRFSTMTLGSRVVRGELYRTTANGSVFYFVGDVNASPGDNVNGYWNFVDVYADTDILQNEALYVDIGQELPASNFPACTFANVGGNRLWMAGGFTGNTITATKQFLPHIVPECADDDAFRITIPADVTGMAWCDSQVAFTQEGIYIISGEGPDGSGNGAFTWSRLPFDMGCIDWRSVDATDAGVFFQSARGLMLLPRGFGPPVQMSQVLDTLSTYPIITSARSSYNSGGGADNSEQVVQWTAVADEAATSGVVVTFDLAYQAFAVDTCSADYPAAFQSGWDGDSVQSPQTMTVGPGGASKWHPFRVRNDLHSDDGLAIDMQLATGDIRPWGTFGHGVVNRVGLLGVLGSACTVSATKLTDVGTRTTTRAYTGIAPDYISGSDAYLDVELGGSEQRDVTALRFTVAESSALEGMAFIGVVIEADAKPQGFRLLKPADRVV